jgi:hypothetical protein
VEEAPRAGSEPGEEPAPPGRHQGLGRDDAARDGGRRLPPAEGEARAPRRALRGGAPEPPLAHGLRASPHPPRLDIHADPPRRLLALRRSSSRTASACLADEDDARATSTPSEVPSRPSSPGRSGSATARRS